MAMNFGHSSWIRMTPNTNSHRCHSLLQKKSFLQLASKKLLLETCWNNARLLTKSSGGGDLGRLEDTRDTPCFSQRCKIIRFQWKLRWKRRISCEHGMNMDTRCVKIERSMRSIRLSLELLLMHNSSYQMLLLCQAIHHILITPKSAACLCQCIFFLQIPRFKKYVSQLKWPTRYPWISWISWISSDKPMASQLATKWPICCFGIVDAETHAQPIRSTEFSMSYSDQSSLTCETLWTSEIKWLVRPGCWNMLEYVNWNIWENALLHHVRMQKNVLSMFGIPYSFPRKTGHDGLWSSWISPQGLLRSAKKARQSKAHWHHLEGLEGPARH